MFRFLFLTLMSLAAFSLTMATVPAGPVCGYYAPTYAPYQYHNTYQTYTPTYYPPIVVKEFKDVVLVPFVQAVVTNPDYYFSVRDYYRDAVALELAQTQRELLRMRQAAYQPPPAGSQGLPVQPPAPQLPGNRLPVPTDIDPALQAAVAKNCVDCHGGNKGTKGDLDLRNLNTLSASQALDCYEQVIKGKMPKGTNPLPDSEAVLFLALVKAKVAVIVSTR